jgi:dihydroflavonol-4-reductase
VKRALVTGASGFVGANLVRELLSEGVAVRALCREGSDLSSLDGLGFEIARGDLLDRDGLARHLAGCDACFHLAAAISAADPRELFRTNVEGTEAILAAAAKAGTAAIVHASTIGTLGRADGRPAREEDVADLSAASDYARSKQAADRACEEAAARGVPVRIAHLAAPVGPWDRVPTVTGARILEALAGKRPSYPFSAVNHVAVKDVARGLILAATKGVPGRRYLLARAGGNLTREEFVALVSRAAGLAAPDGPGLFTRLRGLARRLAGRERPRPSLAVDPSLTVQLLGLPQTDLETAFAEAVAWFRERGYGKGNG